MKNVKSIFRITGLIVALLLSISPIFANSNDEIKDRIEKTYKVSEIDKLSLNVYESDIKINTWKNSEIKITGEILISDCEKEDADKVLNAFKNPEVLQEPGKIDINLSFIESTFAYSFIIFTSYKTKLSTGETVSVKSAKANYEIWIPEKMAIALVSKYNKVKTTDLAGKLDFDLYTVDLDMGNFGDNSTFNMKYSTVNLGSGTNVKFDIYDCKLYVQDLKKAMIVSKYSTIVSKSINLLVSESYTDKYTIDLLNGIDLDAKYTTLKAKGNSNLGKFTLYDCEIEVGDFTRIEYDSKYSEFTANKIGAFIIKESYTDTYRLNEVGEYSSLDSKYNKINIGKVLTSINLPETYDSELNVDMIGLGFTSFKGDFKYGTVKLITNPTLNYRLKFEKTYGEVKYPTARFTNKNMVHLEMDDKAKLEGSTDPNAKCEIEFTTYDTDFTIE